MLQEFLLMLFSVLNITELTVYISNTELKTVTENITSPARDKWIAQS